MNKRVFSVLRAPTIRQMLVATSLIACTQAQATPFELQGRVVGVHDGDTITLLDAEKRQHKVRLDGIDAPELGQPFGKAARLRLSGLVVNRSVVATCSKTDRYRREVCRVQIEGLDAGEEMLRSGLAWCFRRYAKELPSDRRNQYVDLETQAKFERRGLWIEAAPVPPWEWRAAVRKDPL